MEGLPATFWKEYYKPAPCAYACAWFGSADSGKSIIKCDICPNEYQGNVGFGFTIVEGKSTARVIVDSAPSG